MTTPESILLDLSAGQSTADSIAGRLRLPTLVIEAMLKRQKTDGLVDSTDISDGTLTVWHLSYEGKEAAALLKRPGRKSPITPAAIQ